MKIISIGAGPAALYFGILIRERFPTWEVTLLERNALGDTFGWGVVFSDETLSHLLEADPPTHLKITDSFAHWDAIDVHARGETFRSAGHGFSGIARRRLLEIRVGAWRSMRRTSARTTRTGRWGRMLRWTCSSGPT